MKVTFGRLEQAAEETRTAATNISTQLDDLKAAVNRVAQTWTGDAQTAYNQRQEEWNQSAQALNEVLQAIEQNLRQAAENYRTTENQIANVWRG
ncbi:WXG100 family type VII secretion target [Allostreptomyces psammosilenae]|nr:WXG100 family type VII secretion target [Allostreptomyces psammosilenae]